MHKLNMTPWKQKTLAAAATLALAGLSLDVSAFALGAVTVHSHLGEPLRAEIEVPQISEAEAKTLQATLASPQAFQAAGVEYNPAVVGVRVTLHQRKNGQSYLRLVGTRPVNEPFLGIVIESSWSNGRVVRDYTMLIDPADPGKRQTADANQAQTSASKNGGAKPAVAEQVTSARPSKANRSSRTAAASGDGETVTVRRGDTAYGLVASITPQGISLDQMLVALQRANPHAFIRGNVNLLKAGAVVTLPTEEQASAITRSAARRAVVAQSRDFHAYRSGLASHAPRTATASAGRSDSGAVQAHVQEAQPRQSSGDNLILTRGKTRAQAEERIAQNRQARENNEREAELKRNIDQLKQLQTAAAGTAAAPGGGEPAAPSAAPQINVPATAPVVESTPPAAPPTWPRAPIRCTLRSPSCKRCSANRRNHCAWWSARSTTSVSKSTASALARVTARRSSTASSGRCSAMRMKTPMSSPRWKTCCAKPASRKSSCTSSSFLLNSAMTAAHRSTPMWKASQFMPNCRSRTTRPPKRCIERH